VVITVGECDDLILDTFERLLNYVVKSLEVYFARHNCKVHNMKTACTMLPRYERDFKSAEDDLLVTLDELRDCLMSEEVEEYAG